MRIPSIWCLTLLMLWATWGVSEICTPGEIASFVYPKLGSVWYGKNGLDTLPDTLKKLGGKRALILTGASLARGPRVLNRVQTVLADAGFLVGTYTDCRQHVPESTVDAATALAHKTNADVIVTLGGGSPHDTGKLVVQRLRKAGGGNIFHIALPTTLSSGEFTAIAGITSEATRIKAVKGSDEDLSPTTVILDPELTLETPPDLWSATGIKALEHALEAIWSQTPNLVSDLLAERAIQSLWKCLRATQVDPTDLNARLQCQIASWWSVFGLANVRVRLTHIFGHQIGPRWNIPHGVTSAIVLPHGMRFLAPQTLAAQVRIAKALGIRTIDRDAKKVAESLAKKVEGFIDSFGLPRQLRSYGATPEELPEVAHAIWEERRDFWKGTEIQESDVLELLRSMW